MKELVQSALTAVYSGESDPNDEEKLYEKINNFAIDEGTEEFIFAQRLARENRWSPAYANRVIDEYKRFICLMVQAGHPVTPSDQVDQAWHLHLTYTRSYWDGLCQQVIGRPLHHQPTQGGIAEARKFKEWYQRTLDSYRRIFGQAPPSDIWPDHVKRFGDARFYQRVNTRDNWVINSRWFKRIWPQFTKKFVIVAIVLAIGAGFVMEAMSKQKAGFVKTSSHQNFPVEWVWIIFGTVLALWIVCTIFEGYCRKCGRLNALKPTAATEIRKMSENWEEFRCKHCNETVWRKKSTSDGGGTGGCGGCGGCGG